MSNVDSIYTRIWESIVARKLQPGFRLKEEELCEVFGASRGNIRKVLQQLSFHNLVKIIPNSGAFVAEPSIKEAREVFQARRLIETELIRELAANFTPEKRRALEEMLKKEQEAHKEGNQYLRVRLSGEFHLLIGQLADKPVLTGFLHEIIPRSSLILSLYQRPSTQNGRSAGHVACAEHEELIDILESGDADRAVAFMIDHLNELENQLDLEPIEEEGMDLKSIFSV